jgi:hypothetical protein
MKNECNTCKLRSIAASKLSDEQIEKLSFNCAPVKFHKGDSVIVQGALSTNVAYLRSGLAKIHITGPYHAQPWSEWKVRRYGQSLVTIIALSKADIIPCDEGRFVILKLITSRLKRSRNGSR